MTRPNTPGFVRWLYGPGPRPQHCGQGAGGRDSDLCREDGSCDCDCSSCRQAESYGRDMKAALDAEDDGPEPSREED